ncbi:enoyl-CoA hydratase-related protein [Tissierella praeacuta]|uniref:enoyl-CoA hydratase-related protein n=1 Tax=Tissierella praeacuta TaxID=43131 RepID=UPI00333E28BE
MNTDKLFDISKNLKNIKLELDNGIAIVRMNRPKALNALNSDTLGELNDLFEVFAIKDFVKGVIITGEGKGFVAGADIVQMKDYKSLEGRNYANFAQTIFNKIEALEKPVIAAINGYALGGGCELAMSCDLRIAAEKAVFGQPEVKLGVIPCFGGTQRLPRLIGAGKAKELIFTGRQIKADEAFAIGLVNKVVENENLIDEAITMMNEILTMAPMAVGCTKVAINKGLDLDLNNALELEKDLAAITFGSEDKDEGMKALLEKRIPEFKNR